MPRLTVVVATYNRSQSLVRCLESFRTQSSPRTEWEVVVVNNNSKDDTEERFAEFAAANPDLPVRMVREERQGLFSQHTNPKRRKAKDRSRASFAGEDIPSPTRLPLRLLQKGLSGQPCEPAFWGAEQATKLSELPLR